MVRVERWGARLRKPISGTAVLCACRERPCRRRAAEQRDDRAAFQMIELHPAPYEPRPDRAATPAGLLSFISRLGPPSLQRATAARLQAPIPLFKPTFLARQLATSADVYLLASRRFLCESRFCRGGDQNNHSRQCTKKNECAHDFLLNQCCTCKQGNSPKQQRQER